VHVQRPRVQQQRARRAGCKSHVAGCVARQLAQERGDEQPQVLTPFPQGWEEETEPGEAGEQIRAEVLLNDERVRVVVSGGDDPEVDLDRMGGADRLHFLLLEGAQERCLRGERQVSISSSSNVPFSLLRTSRADLPPHPRTPTCDSRIVRTRPGSVAARRN
jgi:hypothetical protein